MGFSATILINYNDVIYNPIGTSINGSCRYSRDILKILKGYSETVSLRRTDNTMDK